MSIVANRKAYHDYFVEEKLEAGLSLLGWEVKAIRAGRAQLKEAYVIVKNITVFNVDIAPCTFELLLVDGATTRVIERSAAVAANGNYAYENPLCLDTTAKSIKIRLIAAKTTNDCDFTAHYVTEA